MSNEDSEPLSSAEQSDEHDDLRAAVAELTERVEALEDELRDERERRREAEAERDDLAERVEELEDWKDDHEVQHDALSNWNDALEERVAEVEDTVRATENVSEGATTFASEDPRKMLPVEKIAELPDDVAKQQLDNETNRNLYRARYVWNHWEDVSHKTGTAENRGSHIKSADVKRILNTWDEENANVESKTVERVFRKLTEWSFWICEIKHREGERRLWRPRDWKDQREDAREEADLKNHPLSDSAVSAES